MTNLDETALFRVKDNSATSPVILHAPHVGRTIPPAHLNSCVMSLTELEAEGFQSLQESFQRLVDST